MALKSVSGSILVTDNHGNQHTLDADDLNFEEVARYNKQMGSEVQYLAESDYGDWSITIEVWEYPKGAYNHHDITVDGGSHTGDLEFEF